MATKYKRGKSWVIQWWERPDVEGEKGQQFRVSIGPVTEREAEAARLSKELELARGIKPKPISLFGVFADRYLQWHATEYPDSHERIRQIVEQHLLRYFGDHDMGMMRPTEVERFKAERMMEVSAGSLTKELRTLQAILNRAALWGAIDRNPIKQVRAPRQVESKPVHFYQVDELQRLYAVSTDWRWAWQFIANTGLRRSEALKARRAHVEGDSLRILSEEGARTKSGKWRTVPLSVGAQAALEHLGDDYLLPRVTKPSMSRAFVRDAKRAGLDGSLHSLRHTFGANLVMRGVPLRTVQVLMGHSTVRVTEQYAHLAPGHLRSAVEGLEL